MRLKSAYREKADPKSSVDVKIPSDPAAAADIPASEAEVEGAAILRQQMESMRKSTEHEHQQAQPSPSLEAKLDQWRQAGLPEAEISFLRQHPQMAGAPELTQVAAHEALAAGHAMGTPGFHSHMKERFDFHMAEIERRAAAVPPAAEKTVPEYFKPRPPPAEPSHEERMGGLVSAPVSRGIPTGSYKPAGSRSITLTAAQREAARMAGVSEAEYARQLLRLSQEKERGNYQGQP